MGVDWLSRFGYLPPPDPVTGQLQTKEALTKAIKAMQKYGGIGGDGSAREADVQVEFTKADHNDGYPFDGPGGTVAHAFYPGDRFTAGDTHFDDDEDWTFRSPDAHGMDLFAVAVHEFGHAIGLAHTSSIESIMRPYYQGPVGDPLKYSLPYEDKVHVWQLYGVRDSAFHTDRPHSSDSPVLLDLPENRSTVPPAPDTPDGCSTHFDAVVQIRGEGFFFKGRYFWRLTREKHLVSLRPAQIHRFWRGLPTNLDSVDAVYERPGDHKIVFFKGFGRTDFGLPLEGVDAVFVWLPSDKTHFFKGSRYWHYDDYLQRMDLGYPKYSMLWKGVPPQLDDAMGWSDGYPRPIGQDWLLCADMQSDSPALEANGTETRSHSQRHASHVENNYVVCSCTSDLSLLWTFTVTLPTSS
ncbi:hypothetical protein SKAU_G00006840 [Synaphobranchus kaupii]|uniref:Peptidase metallopeptidase domain-containing protein n=1 Tax=Synaphobranchus kaupii TaxID=118154 RepID=A0A9Q1G9A1_SYNKA|nr:hypothetical protein SKAU_G00006840 [Synaphobranchus kaupii]